MELRFHSRQTSFSLSQAFESCATSTFVDVCVLDMGTTEVGNYNYNTWTQQNLWILMTNSYNKFDTNDEHVLKAIGKIIPS